MSNYKLEATHCMLTVEPSGHVCLSSGKGEVSDDFFSVSHGVAIVGPDGKHYALEVIMRVFLEHNKR